MKRLFPLLLLVLAGCSSEPKQQPLAQRQEPKKEEEKGETIRFRLVIPYLKIRKGE